MTRYRVSIEFEQDIVVDVKLDDRTMKQRGLDASLAKLIAEIEEMDVDAFKARLEVL